MEGTKSSSVFIDEFVIIVYENKKTMVGHKLKEIRISGNYSNYIDREPGEGIIIESN